MKKLGEVLKLYRKWMEMSLRAFAEELDISASTLQRIEAGGMPDAETLMKILNWLTKVEASNEAPANRNGEAQSTDQPDEHVREVGQSESA